MAKCAWCPKEAENGSRTCCRSHAAAYSRARKQKAIRLLMLFGLSADDAVTMMQMFRIEIIERAFRVVGYEWRNRNWSLKSR